LRQLVKAGGIGEMSMNAAMTLSEALVGAVERAAARTVRVDARGRMAASGLLWSDGVVVATDHTIEREDDLGITLPDGSSTRATIAGRDPGSDLAVLRIAEGSTGPLEAAESISVGQLVLAVGRPREIAASAGILSAIGGPRRRRGGGAMSEFIRPDLTMYPGFSGGPLVDARGAIIGINTSGLRGGALTIPLTAATTIVDQLLAHGRLKRGYLGLSSQPVRLPAGVAEQLGRETGLLTIGVETGSPADAGGMFVGDILLTLGEHLLSDTDDLRTALSAESGGQPVELRVLRGGVPLSLSITIGER
jgi:S1-C subfamily serine protease